MTQPKYQIGTAVKVMIETTDKYTGLKFNNPVTMFICGISLNADDQRNYYDYSVSVNLPQPYAYGNEVKIKISEKNIVLA